MRIVALDFETANNSLSSACALGISIYEDGELLDNFEWLIKPHRRFLFFTNTPIHGISLDDVINEKEFVYYYEELKDIIKDSLILAHNTCFDINVLNNLCDLYGLDHYDFEYFDTVKLSRRIFPELRNHKLNTICEYLDIPLNHHQGQSDSLACLLIFLKAMEMYECEDSKALFDKLRLKTTTNH